MANVNAVLNQRIKKTQGPSSKMAAMAQASATGNLTSFAGVFSVVELSEQEKESIECILKSYGGEDKDIYSDLNKLLSITSEVKAINNQAAILHGERIKKAHTILINYQEGAFTAWLMAAYGNRQTPYNLMQYYEFYEAIPKHLRQRLETMPRQAVYALASREGNLETKQKVVEDYQGQTKREMLNLIRQIFPLKQTDKRKQKISQGIVQVLERLYHHMQGSSFDLTTQQKKRIQELLQQIHQLVG